jgi:hypothetical protein
MPASQSHQSRSARAALSAASLAYSVAAPVSPEVGCPVSPAWPGVPLRLMSLSVLLSSPTSSTPLPSWPRAAASGAAPPPVLHALSAGRDVKAIKPMSNLSLCVMSCFPFERQHARSSGRRRLSLTPALSCGSRASEKNPHVEIYLVSLAIHAGRHEAEMAEIGGQARTRTAPSDRRAIGPRDRRGVGTKIRRVPLPGAVGPSGTQR